LLYDGSWLPILDHWRALPAVFFIFFNAYCDCLEQENIKVLSLGRYDSVKLFLAEDDLLSMP
jgi:hypothetical protein